MKNLFVITVVMLTVSCKAGGNMVEEDKGTVDAPQTIASVPEETEEKAEPIACKSDGDCPRRSCGPCTPGEVMTDRRMSVSCAVNPCTNSRSICGPRGLCIVHPDTVMRESLRSEACIKLIRDKWSLLCKGKTDEAARACEDIVDAAAARDDTAMCEAARAKLTD